MTALPLVTIMIPTYNQAAYIAEAIESALAQSYPNLDVVVGDDASTDATPEIVARYLTDQRLRYVRHDKNLGRTGNYRSLLGEHARGEYVVNLDGDDFYTDPDFVAEAVRCVLAQRALIVVARAHWRIRGRAMTSCIPRVASIAGTKILAAMPDKRFYFKHMATLYSRQAALAADFYRTDAISADWESLYRLCLQGRVAFLERDVGVWRQHDENATRTINIEKIYANLDIWRAVYATARAEGMPAWQAAYRRACCVAHFAASAAIGVSRSGNLTLLHYVAGLFWRYPVASTFALLRPKSLVRFLLCFAGYYRRCER